MYLFCISCKQIVATIKVPTFVYIYIIIVRTVLRREAATSYEISVLITN